MKSLIRGILGLGLVFVLYGQAMAHTVNVDWLNVRSGPGTGYSVIGVLPRGTVVLYVSISGSWTKISSPKSGWVYSPYLSDTPHATTAKSLNITWYRQVTNYYCGPTTAQMVIRYLSGRYIYQSTLASFMGTTSWAGSSAANVSRGVRYYTGQSYTTVSGFSRTRVVANINRNIPVHINFNCRYLAYTGYRNVRHHSPIKGYTSGGYYIHDSAWGPDRWASSTQTYNAVRYHYNLYSVRY